MAVVEKGKLVISNYRTKLNYEKKKATKEILPGKVQNLKCKFREPHNLKK